MAGSGKVNEGRWGEALWNQRPRIDTYTQDNINFTEQVAPATHLPPSTSFVAIGM
jgi:hypothetical protein